MQFPLNATIYRPSALNIPSSELSFLDWFLREREILDSYVRRYQAPDEYPFFPSAIQEPILKPLHYPQILWTNNVNVNSKIKNYYVQEFLPKACLETGRGDRGEAQENYGSAATCDIACLQALSRRIHFGKFVAESKFLAERAKYTAMIQAEDRDGIAEAITNKAVEAKVLERLRLKASTYGTDPSASASTGHGKINVEAVVSMYEDFVIPLTKVVEVEYLMQRLEPA